MSKGSNLLLLVQSLGLNEKRYFKLQAALQKKDSNLSRLFDYYAEATTYDENVLRLKFEGEKFLEQLAVTQNHLYESILKAMRSYHLKHSEEYRLNGMLQDAGFLFEKGLIDQAMALLKKIRKAAVKSDSFLVVLKVVEWEARMIADQHYGDYDESDIDRLSDEYYEMLGILQNEREYADLQSKIFNNYYKVGVERANSDYKTNDQIMNQFALKDEFRAQTFRSKLCYLNIHAQYNKINGNWSIALEYRQKIAQLSLVKFNENHSPEAMNRYLVALINLIPIQAKLERWEELKQTISRMEQLEHSAGNARQSIRVSDKIMAHTFIAKICLLTVTGSRESGLDEVHKLLNENARIDRMDNHYLVHHLHFTVAYFLFTIGHNSPSLRWLNKIVNSDNPCKIEDLNASIRILSLLAQFEIGRNELLDYLARSTKRYLDKLEGLYGFEEIILDFMKRVSKNDMLRHDRSAYVSLKSELAKVGYEPGDRNALSTIDLNAWVDSKINNISMWEQLKSNHENRGKADH